MTPRIFAYIVHKDGVADDTAAELAVAARKIDAEARRPQLSPAVAQRWILYAKLSAHRSAKCGKSRTARWLIPTLNSFGLRW